MPLMVPILRFAMLFLNIYDSYKTLRAPPPSSRNNGRPSLRALSQRKRDMKGCLAVWVVWCCFTTYERMAEGIVSLLIPFYDEFKSLLLLFLIMTRARGAEPIYLHVIRPFLKPYTPMLDTMLDLVCMVGDILFVLATSPFHFALAWWEKIVGANEATLESEAESTLYLSLQSGRRGAQAEVHARSNAQSRGPSRDKSRYRSTGSNLISNGRQSYQIWDPPQSYSDAEEDSIERFVSEATGEPRNPEGISGFSGEIIRDQGLVDEWRQYPPFPSAYPPTPLVNYSQLSTSMATVRSHRRRSGTVQLLKISEHVAPQDFKRSPLPPREPLNLGSAGDPSDNHRSLGVHNDRKRHDATMDVDADSEIDEDEEDEFNTTLKTPLPLSGTVRSQIRVSPNHLPSPASSETSLPSRSTALTTIDNGSSLRTRTSSESLSSAAISNSDVSSLLGKKRSLPHAKVIAVGDRDHLLNGPTKVGSNERIISKSPIRRRTPRRARVVLRPETSTSETVDDDSDTSSSVNSTGDDSVSDRNPPDLKKRKVAKSQMGAVKSTRPIRPRITRSATTSASRTQNLRSLDGPSIPSRSSTRLRSQSAMRGTETSSSVEASGNGSSANHRVHVHREGFGGRNTTKK